MKKKVYIVNGMARSGKDTFAKYLDKLLGRYKVLKVSSIDVVKCLAENVGWNENEKDEKSRKFLSDLKMLLTEYNDLPFKDIQSTYKLFTASHYYDGFEVLLIDIREPHEIERAKKEFNAEAILIKNDNVKQITSNDGDAGVYDYDGYDHIIENNGTLEEFYINIRKFAIKQGLFEDLI